MNGITVTMPIEEYERMKKQIETLNAKNVENFIDRNYNSVLDHHDIVVNVQGIVSTLNKEMAKEIAKDISTRFKTLV